LKCDIRESGWNIYTKVYVIREIIEFVFGKLEEGKMLDEKKVWGFRLCSKYVNMWLTKIPLFIVNKKGIRICC